ncbi:uncharacterized protein LOC122293745 [Carya illinoinensis]|uniref:uncharacterized protein LOC122293745 n=1 Tax=Carya illinoinensis TaxID=32201 RepID=UPI001C7282F0|nr:uncharacterized protein LOC122293745 [Carya illinoinensis]
MEEDLTKRWERLRLSTEETSTVKITAEESKDTKLRGKWCLVGKVLSEKGVNNEAFRITMSQIWRLNGWVRFKDPNEQVFLIEFQSEQDLRKVLGGRTWFFDRNLLTLQEVNENESVNALQFRYEPFWVQCHNFPLAAMNETIGEKFGSSFGHVVQVESDSDGLALGQCLRIRMALDIHKALLRGKWLEIDQKKHWISLKYERLQSFCFHCGVLFHKNNRCSRQRYEQNSVDKQDLPFGP